MKPERSVIAFLPFLFFLGRIKTSESQLKSFLSGSFTRCRQRSRQVP